MPPRKHQRAASDPSSNAGPSAKASKIVKVERSDALPRATFQDLPFELRKAILDLACSRNNAVDSKMRLSLDSNTLFNLIFVSREFYATLKPILWRHVKLVRPSALAEFRQALVRHPANGQLVRNLHIGPLSDLPRGWWPVRAQQPDQEWLDSGAWMLFRTGLTRCDEAIRPLWCKPDKEWASCLPGRTCQGGAVAQAIRAALKGVDISLGDPFNDPGYLTHWGSGRMGINLWTLRLFEAQGVLDLYLAGMRRVEEDEDRPIRSWRGGKRHPVGKDPRDCCNARCEHYPELVLEGFGDRGAQNKDKEPPEGDTIVVRHEDVMKHLARRGAHTDNFEHPVIFAQSDLRILSQRDDGTITVNYDQKARNNFYPDPESDDEDNYHGDLDDMLYRFNDDDWSQSSLAPLRPKSPTDSESSAYDTFDLLQHNGISALASSVLRRTPKVLNLSLTGFLSQCLHHPPMPSLLRKLRCLSLGPPGTPPGVIFNFQDLWLPAMEKLRFCGSYLTEASHISGRYGNWRNMREAQWDFGTTELPRGGNVEWILSIVHELQGRKRDERTQQSADVEADEPVEVDAPTQDELALLSSTVPSSECRYTDVRVHPTFVSRVLEMAPTPEIRRAWRYGFPVSDAPHRVRVVESRAAKNVPSRYSWFIGPPPLQDYDVHRAESAKWWEECAWELEHEGKSSRD